MLSRIIKTNCFVDRGTLNFVEQMLNQKGMTGNVSGGIKDGNKKPGRVFYL
jgi:hypothetical protein